MTPLAQSQMQTVRIVIADDHPLMRQALAEAVANDETFGADILEAGTFEAVRSLLAAVDPDLVLLDLNMPGVQSLEGVVALRAEFPAVPLLVISGVEDSATALRALELGASGFLPKSAPVATVNEAIRTVLQGEIWLSTRTFEGIATAPVPPRRAQIQLSPQQERVLRLLMQGKLNKEIAFEMSLTPATVKAHLTQLFRKLGVHTRTQAVVLARTLIRG